MRDELGSWAPGSFTAVVLFYIYGAAAGPAVARCESHDSSAGNRDGPVIQAPHRLHVTSLALPNPLLDDHRSLQHQAECPQTHVATYTWLCSFYGHIHPSICFPGPSLCNYLHNLIRLMGKLKIFKLISKFLLLLFKITLLEVSLSKQTVSHCHNFTFIIH